MKKLVIGIVIGFMLATATNAFAAVGDSVTAVFANFNYKVNGQDQTLDSPVLVYDGNSYLRTTQIANMLGYDVTYKADSRTIAFDNTTNTPIPTTAAPVPISTPTATTSVPIAATPAPMTTTATAAPITSPTVNSATPTPISTSAPTPTPTPTTNAAACQEIRNNYGAQIAMVGYSSLAEGPKHQKVYELQYYENKELAAAGCN